MTHKKHMMSIFKLGLIGFGICLLLLGYAFILSMKNNYKDDGQVDVKYKVYTNNQYGFQMNIPETWVETNKILEDTDFALVDTKGVKDYKIINGLSLTKDELQNRTFDEAVKDIMDMSLTSKTKILSNNKVIVGGFESRLIKTEVEGYTHYEIYVNRGSDGLSIFMGSYRNERLDKYDKNILDSLLSIKFLK